MKLAFTKTFIKNYRQLPGLLQQTIDKQVALLLSSPQHPSLNIKKMSDRRNICEGMVTPSYRFTFQIKKNTYILRRAGTHDILKNP